MPVMHFDKSLKKWASRPWNPTYSTPKPKQTETLYLHMPAMEANLDANDFGGSSIGTGESMVITLCTDKIIEQSGLKPITSSIMFGIGGAPAEGGLFDPNLVGATPTQRQRTYTYIDLKRKYFHPYIFEILKQLSSTFGAIATGNTCGYIDENGKLTAIKDPEDPNFNEDNTGIPWLIENYSKIVWNKTESMINQDRNRLLADLKPEQIFITKWPVIPIFYRDKEEVNGRPSVHEISKKYNQIIQYSNSTDPLFDNYNNALYFKVQMCLVDLRQLGQSLIEKKKGHYHRNILGKSIDYGSRDVISVAVMNEVQHPKDNQIDIFHTGIPLAKCLVLGQPLMSRWVMNFFEDNFKNKDFVTVGNLSGKTRTVEIKELKDHSLIYDKKTIDKAMKRFINTYGSRFEPIKVYFKDGTMSNFYYTGLMQPTTLNSPNASSIMNRPMTWTDLFYIAAMDCCADKFVYTTRYPVLTYSGTFPSQVVPMSTVETTKAIVDGKVYDHYPLIDVNMPPNEVATKFIDTLTISDLYLSALGGDWTSIMIPYDSNIVQEKFCERLTSGVCLLAG